MNRTHSRENRRALIVQAAISCFIEKGFHSTSMRDIAQAASVSLGNLYNYFPGKESLIAEVASLEQTELAPLRQRLAQAAFPSLELVRAFLSDYRAMACQREWAILSAECLAEIARTPELAPAFEVSRRYLLDALTDALVRGLAQGAFALPAPAALIAQVLLDAVESEALRATLMSSSVAGRSDTDTDVLHPGLLRSLLGVSGT